MDNIEPFSGDWSCGGKGHRNSSCCCEACQGKFSKQTLPESNVCVVTLVLQVAYKDKEVPVLSIEEALKREGRVSRLSWEEVANLSIFLDCFTWAGG